MCDRRGHVEVGERHEHDAPGAVVDDSIGRHRVEAAARHDDSRADRAEGGAPGTRHVRVVVVVNVVVSEERARPVRAAGAQAQLWRRGIVVVLAVGDDPGLVVVPLGVLDDQMAPGVGPGVAERAVLRMGVGKHLVAVTAGPDVIARIVHVAGVGVRERSWAPAVAREDPVRGGRLAGRVVSRGRVEVSAPERARDAPAAAVSEVEPDLVAGAALTLEEVAGGQVLDAHARCLEHLDPVATVGLTAHVRSEVLIGRRAAAPRCARLGPIDDDAVSIHAAHMDARRRDHDTRALLGQRPIPPVAVAALVVVPGADQDPVARLR